MFMISWDSDTDAIVLDHNKLLSYLWLDKRVNVVASWADKAYLAVEKVVSVSFSVACTSVPLQCWVRRNNTWIINMMSMFRRTRCFPVGVSQWPTFMSWRFWRGKLETWLLLASGPRPLLVLLLFLRLCLRCSWSFLLCFLLWNHILDGKTAQRGTTKCDHEQPDNETLALKVLCLKWPRQPQDSNTVNMIKS